MRTNTLLLAPILAGTALALPEPAPVANPLPVPAAHALITAAPDALAARQFTSGGGNSNNNGGDSNSVGAGGDDSSKSRACSRSYVSLIQNYPTPSSNVLRWIVSETEVANMFQESGLSACDNIPPKVTPPASVKSDFDEWWAELTSYQADVAPEASSLAQSCGGTISSSLLLAVATDRAQCRAAMGAAGRSMVPWVGGVVAGVVGVLGVLNVL